MDMNQFYSLNLLKVGDSLTIETYSKEHGCKTDAKLIRITLRLCIVLDSLPKRSSEVYCITVRNFKAQKRATIFEKC